MKNKYLLETFDEKPWLKGYKIFENTNKNGYSYYTLKRKNFLGIYVYERIPPFFEYSARGVKAKGLTRVICFENKEFAVQYLKLKYSEKNSKKIKTKETDFDIGY